MAIKKSTGMFDPGKKAKIFCVLIVTALSLILIQLFLGSTAGFLPTDPQILLISDSTFHPKGSTQVFPMRSGLLASSAVPKNYPCCEGSIEIQIPKKIADLGVNDFTGMGMLPRAIGCGREIRIGSAKFDISKSDWSSVGPIIPIPADALGALAIIDIECPRDRLLSGLALGGNYFGPIVQLQKFRESMVLYQTTIPTANFLFFVGGALIMLYLSKISPGSRDIYRTMAFGMISWSIFQLFLAGHVRAWNEDIGARLHFAARSIASAGNAATLMAWATFFKRRKWTKVTARNHRIIWTAYVSISAVAGFKLDLQLNSMIMVLAMIVSYWPLASWLANHRQSKWSNLELSILCVASIAGIGALFDAVKFVSMSFGHPSYLAYFDRITTAIFFAVGFMTLFRNYGMLHGQLAIETLRASKADTVGRTVKMLAHDIRAPFSTIRAAVKVFAATPDEQLRAKVGLLTERIETMSNRTEAMLQDIMNIGSSIALHKTSFSLKTLIQDVSQGICESRGPINIGISSESDVPIFADRTKLYRVFQNILLNAVEASPKKLPIMVRVSESNSGASNVNSFLIEITNHGTVINPARIKSLFTEFYSDKGIRGTGLGLAVCKEFVDAHEGEIWARSATLEGTTICVVLPMQTRMESDGPQI